jgi:hypothetical protein
MITLGQRSLPALTTRLLLASVLIVWPAVLLSPPPENQSNIQPASGTSRLREGESVWRRLTEYSIKARVPVLGDIGRVGAFAIEQEVRRNGCAIEKVFRIFGSSMPELIKKGKDYCGELEVVRTLPPEGEGQLDRPAAEESGRATGSSSGYFKKNGVSEGESIVFFPDYAVSRRENGSEKRVEGSCGCLISAIEHFLECEVRECDVFESRFVLGGRPFIFKCEVGRATRLQSRGAKVFPIDFTTYDGVERDDKGMPKVVKKKGGIRLWLSKEEPFKDTYLRLMIQYRWYLALHMEIVKST